MKKYDLFKELNGCYHLEELQRMGLIPLPNEDMTQGQMEEIWGTTDGYYLLLIDDEECEKVYDELFNR